RNGRRRPLTQAPVSCKAKYTGNIRTARPMPGGRLLRQMMGVRQNPAYRPSVFLFFRYILPVYSSGVLHLIPANPMWISIRNYLLGV
ncbi:MAG: hypothetical protein WCS46_03605, partial [Bacteroidales bacterium]